MEPIEHNTQSQGQITDEKMLVQKDYTQYATPLAIIVASLIVAGSILYTGLHAQTNTSANPSVADTQNIVDIKKVKTAGEPFIGAVNAPVTIAYWSDYQCPFCKQFETTALTDVIKNYVQAGKVRIIFKDFQFLGPDSQTAGLAARAVWDLFPEQYYTWREAMFNAQDAENGGFGNKANIIALTRTIAGINADAVSSAMDSKKDVYQKQLDADKEEGAGLGVKGTPALIIGKDLIPGALDYTHFVSVIDAQLKK